MFNKWIFVQMMQKKTIIQYKYRQNNYLKSSLLGAFAVLSAQKHV